MQWSIQQIARLSGTTSRTLRHYDDLGLLPPTSIGANGYRYYDEAALTRLQRILLLRELGLGLPAIAEVLAGQTDDTAALESHLGWLEHERDRVDRQIASVTTTILKLRGGEQLMAEEMLDGFDHTVYKDEVVERWGAETYATSDRWWRELGAEGQAAFKAEAAAIRAGWGGTAPSADAYRGLGDMYVADPRFAKHYGGFDGAECVRDAMRVYAEAELD